MTKGTPSQGKKSGKITHIHCRRCGQKSYHRNKHKCSSCGYGKSAKMRDYSWKKSEA
ncbi:MAG: 50S ribosomal protein L37e [archaeon]